VRNAAGPRIQDLVAGPPRRSRDGDHRVTRINGVDACGVTLYLCSPCDAISAPLVFQTSGAFLALTIARKTDIDYGASCISASVSLLDLDFSTSASAPRGGALRRGAVGRVHKPTSAGRLPASRTATACIRF
jgi:hypothetical protein